MIQFYFVNFYKITGAAIKNVPVIINKSPISDFFDNFSLKTKYAKITDTKILN